MPGCLKRVHDWNDTLACGNLEFLDRAQDPTRAHFGLATSQPDFSHGNLRGVLAGCRFPHASRARKQNCRLGASALSTTYPATTANAKIILMKPGHARETRGRGSFLAPLIVMVGLLFFAPLPFGSVQPWAWGAMSILVLVSLALWALAGARQGELKVLISPLYVPAALALFLAEIQYWGRLTVDPVSSPVSIIKLAIDLVLFFLAGQLLAAGSAKVRAYFGLIVCAYGFGMAVLAILQFFSS